MTVSSRDGEGCRDGDEDGLTVVIDHGFNVPQNLTISPMRLRLSVDKAAPVAVEDSSRLRVENERDSKETLDPFCQTQKSTRTSAGLFKAAIARGQFVLDEPMN